MDNITLNLDDIPRGHNKSFREGIHDGLKNKDNDAKSRPEGHQKSYTRGYQVGIELRAEINNKAK